MRKHHYAILATRPADDASEWCVCWTFDEVRYWADKLRAQGYIVYVRECGPPMEVAA